MGFSIRVFRRGKITKAFRTYHDLAVRLANYPLLDEDDYYAREYEATIENIGDAAWKLKNEYELAHGLGTGCLPTGLRNTTAMQSRTAMTGAVIPARSSFGRHSMALATSSWNSYETTGGKGQGCPGRLTPSKGA